MAAEALIRKKIRHNAIMIIRETLFLVIETENGDDISLFEEITTIKKYIEDIFNCAESLIGPSKQL